MWTSQHIKNPKSQDFRGSDPLVQWMSGSKGYRHSPPHGDHGSHGNLGTKMIQYEEAVSVVEKMLLLFCDFCRRSSRFASASHGKRTRVGVEHCSELFAKETKPNDPCLATVNISLLGTAFGEFVENVRNHRILRPGNSGLLDYPQPCGRLVFPINPFVISEPGC